MARTCGRSTWTMLVVVLVLAGWCTLVGDTSAFAASTAGAVGPTGETCSKPEQLGLVIIVDDSRSNDWTDPTNLRGEAAAIAIDQVSTGTVVATSLFSSEAQRLSPPVLIDSQTRSTQRPLVRDSLDQIGGTEYQAAFVEAQEQLALMPAGVDRRAVVFLSDGEPNNPYDADLPIAAAGTPIYTIGFGGADMSELTGISTRSGGQHWTVTDAVDLQQVFGEITALLGCTTSKLGGGATLAPGASAAIPFEVGACEDELRALATWQSGGVSVHLVRPDGTILDAAHVAEWERFVEQPTYVSANSTIPEPGDWYFVATADVQNLVNVAVTINLWGSDCPVAPPPADPGPIDPAPVDPAPSDPAPTDPSPTEPPPVTPTPKDPTPTSPPPAPTSTDPAPRMPEPAAPTPRTPAPATSVQPPTDCTAVARWRGARSSVQVSWTAAAGHPLLTGYEVQAHLTATRGWKGRGRTITTTRTIHGHAPRSSWMYRVRSTYADGSHSAWCAANVTIPRWNRYWHGTAAVERVVGSTGPDLLAGRGGADRLDGRGGNDTLHGGIGDDLLLGGPGNDLLEGAAGRDRVSGGAGDDVVKVREGSGGDRVNCGPGRDQVFADAADIVAADCERVVRT